MVIEELQVILQEQFEINTQTFNLSTPLVDLGIDSLKILELTYHIETRFNISFTEDHLDLTTVKDLVETIEKLLPQKIS
jgi:acyl carrier protein